MKLSAGLAALVAAMAFAAVPPASVVASAGSPLLFFGGNGDMMTGPIWADGSAGKNAASISVLSSFFPPPSDGKFTGAAVLIIPSSSRNTYYNDGAQLTRWLGERGIMGFILDYRRPPNDRSDAIADVNRAMQFLRDHSADFKISPNRIGLLGFAQGADLVAAAAYSFPVAANPAATDPIGKFSTRPDFLALIWGSAPLSVGAAAPPPTFLVGSTSAADGQSGMIDLRPLKNA